MSGRPLPSAGSVEREGPLRVGSGGRVECHPTARHTGGGGAQASWPARWRHSGMSRSSCRVLRRRGAGLAPCPRAGPCSACHRPGGCAANAHPAPRRTGRLRPASSPPVSGPPARRPRVRCRRGCSRCRRPTLPCPCARGATGRRRRRPRSPPRPRRGRRRSCRAEWTCTRAAKKAKDAKKAALGRFPLGRSEARSSLRTRHRRRSRRHPDQKRRALGAAPLPSLLSLLSHVPRAGGALRRASNSR